VPPSVLHVPPAAALFGPYAIIPRALNCSQDNSGTPTLSMAFVPGFTDFFQICD
jgi:hypothetical protein